MPKVGVVKFDNFGNEMKEDKKGMFELSIYYSNSDNNFYFDRKELEKKFPDTKVSEIRFGVCDTRDKAVALIKITLSTELKPKRMLALSVSIGQLAMSAYQEQRPKGSKDKDLMWATEIDSSYDSEATKHALGLKLKRLLLYEVSDNKEDDLLVPARDTWTVPSYKAFSTRRQHEKSLLVEWTEEREAYLLNACQKLDKIGANLLLFLAKGMAENSSDFGKFIDQSAFPALEAGFEGQK